MYYSVMADIRYFDAPFTQDAPGDLVAKVQSLSIPILDDQSKYEVSVQKLVVPLMTLPAWIAEMQLNDPNPNWTNTVYSCYMNAKSGSIGVTSTVQILQLYPEYDSEPDNRDTQPTNRYAWVSSYNSIAQMINSALNNCLLNMIATTPALGPGFLNDVRIRCYFDDDAQKFCFGVYPYQYFETSTPTGVNSINFYFSENMRFMFSGFQISNLNTVPPSLRKNYFRLITNSKPNQSYYPSQIPFEIPQPPPTPPIETNGYAWSKAVFNGDKTKVSPWQNSIDPSGTYLPSAIVMTSNWSPLTFCPISSIIVSTTMPILPETTLVYSNVTSVSSNVTSYLSNILFDMTIDPTQIGDTQAYIAYNAGTVDMSRRTRLQSYGPLNTFQVSILWTDIFNNIRYLNTNSLTQKCTMKLAFKRVE